MNLQSTDGSSNTLAENGDILRFYGMLETEMSKGLPLVADDSPER